MFYLYQQSLTFPKLIIALYLLVLLFLSQYIHQFTIDASLDSLSLENDGSVNTYSASRQQFGSDDDIYLILNHNNSLFSRQNINTLANINDTLNQLPSIASTTSLVNVPIFNSRRASVLSLMKKPAYLTDQNADLSKLEKAVINNPIYQETIISRDGKTTTFLLKAQAHQDQFYSIEQQRNQLKKTPNLSREEQEELASLDQQYWSLKQQYNEKRDDLIREVDDAMSSELFDSFEHSFLGGGPVIIYEIIQYLHRDMMYFGFGIIALSMLILTYTFRHIYWSVLPVAICVSIVMGMIGFLGWLKWEVTIVTANFPALLFIISLAMMIHVMINLEQSKSQSTNDALNLSLNNMFTPCLYTTVTTMIGFISLIASQIRPIMDLGFIMCIGLTAAFITVFLVLPAMIKLLKMDQGTSHLLDQTANPCVLWVSTLSQRCPTILSLLLIGVVIIGSFGMTRLTVDNRFVDYFMAETNIHKSLEFIDNELGGTIPLEIILKRLDSTSWLNYSEQPIIDTIHQWVSALPHVGKVASLSTLSEYIEYVTKQRSVSPSSWTLLTKTMPESASRLFLTPYLSDDEQTTRILVRVPDSNKDLKRNELYHQILDYLEQAQIDQPWEYEVTGLFVLYNNMLQSLFKSQIVTIGVVYGVIWLMFILLFRSISVATIAIIPNILPVIIVLGLLGWLNIPLDMMTIMIAAITLGLSVDFAIHYVHRFKQAVRQSNDYDQAVSICNQSIGTSIFYMTTIFILGFSIFLISNFLPSIYFGFLTGLAVFMSFFTSLTLLPMLLKSFKPF
ncbi:MAG: hypothetical protein CMF46_00200 [Legionellales bacterium]|nr:hypothetical protein [Legionellales bacterium]